jgi:hypothetical protein
MFSRTTRSHAPSSNGRQEASACSNSTRFAEGVPKLPPHLGDHLAGEVDADDLGVREALGDRECAGTVPAPRSSARRGAWTVSSAATSGARLCSALIVSQRGKARRPNSSSIGRRSQRQSVGRRTPSIVAIRAKRRPIASWTFTLEWRCARPVPTSSPASRERRRP